MSALTNSPTHADVDTDVFENMLLDQLMVESTAANTESAADVREAQNSMSKKLMDWVHKPPNRTPNGAGAFAQTKSVSLDSVASTEQLMESAFEALAKQQSVGDDDDEDNASKQNEHVLRPRCNRLNARECGELMEENDLAVHSDDGDALKVQATDACLERDESGDGQWRWADTTATEHQRAKSVKQIQFGLLAPDEIRRMSVVEVTQQRLFSHNVPVENGLYDRRMGSVMRQFNCTTCEQKFKDCPGHIGRIELAAPLYHPSFIDTVVRVLNTLCLDCSALLVPKTKRFVERQARCKRSQERLRIAHDLVKNKTTNKQCCGTPAAQRYRLPFSELQTGVTAPMQRKKSTNTCADGIIRALEHGCGHYQPKVMREGIKIVLRYPDLPKKVRDAAKKKKKKANSTPASTTLSGGTKRKRDTDQSRDNEPIDDASDNDAADIAEDDQNDDMDNDDDDDDEDDKDGDDKIAADDESAAAGAERAEKEYDRARRERAGSQRVITTEEVLNILRRISDEDCWLLGFDPQHGHPAWMILTVLVVPPPVIRPPTISQFSKKPLSHNHLTLALQDIVKENQKLRKQIEHKISTFQDNFKILLQYYVATYIDNDTKGVPKAQVSQSSEKERDGIVQRFKGKEGRLRGNLMGKRVNFSSRTVITPDPNLAINQLGVPECVARDLTIPERVNRLNIERLQRAVLLGPDAIAGAKNVIDEHGQMFNLQFRRDIKLKFGYVVERHLRNGDIVAFNRQPSLHKFSIMAHRVRIMPGKTFRINLSVCGPYNADFDGDEMNMFVPQSLQASAELATLMETSRCIVTPLNNKPIIGLCQDALLGARLFTQRNVFLTRADLMQLLMWASLSREKLAGRLPQPCILRPQALWSGKQVVSLLLPSTMHIKPSTNNFAPDDERDKPLLTPSDCVVHVRHGTLLSGIWDKKFVGTTHGSIVHVLNNDFGHTVARVFMEEMQALLQCYVTEMRGMSVGVGDCMPDDATKRRVREVVDGARGDVRALVQARRAGRIEPQPGMNVEQTFEARMNQVLNKARDSAGRHVSASFDVNRNNLKLMVTAGSKGGDVNIAQIAGLVGQQNLNGGRIPQMFRDRGMPHVNKFDIEDVESRGFVAHSYIDGLTPMEMLMHAAGGREGLVDTACKSVIGETPIYVQENGQMRRVEIGPWIDGLMAAAPRESIVHEDEADLELLDIADKQVFIPTVDAAGKVTYGHMTAVTRHDPGAVLYRLCTEGGREVTVTASKSVLVFDFDKQRLVEVEPHKLQVGVSHLPVAINFPESENRWNPQLVDRLYGSHGDVRLLPLISIEKVDVAAHPKVYDVTVPSTLNFGIANGLMIRDTADIGYIQRRMVKAGEDVSVAHDGTVRNSNNRVVQFIYGDDGMDGACFEWQQVPLLEMSNKDVYRVYGPDSKRYSREECALLEKETELLILARDRLRRCLHPSTEVRWPLPGNVRRYAERLALQHARGRPLDIAQTLQMLNEFNEQLLQCIDPSGQYRARAESAMFFYAVHLRAALSPRMAIERLCLTYEALRALFDYLLQRHNSWQVAAGEGVGVLAAQAIGEPATQIFHFAGISAKNVTLGVPRLEELIKASKSVKTPTLSIYLDYDSEKLFCASDNNDTLVLRQSLERRARRLAGTLKQVCIGDLTRSTKVLYHPLQNIDESTREGATLRRWQTLVAPHVRQARADEFGPLLDWVLRIDLSRSRLLERRLSVASVGQALLRHYDGAVEVVYSDENDIASVGAEDARRDDDEANDDGGFVFVRMHAYALFDALRIVLPAHHRALLRQVELALEAAERRAAAAEKVDVLGTEAMEMRAKKRRRRDVSAKKAAKDNGDTATAICPTSNGDAVAATTPPPSDAATVDEQSSEKCTPEASLHDSAWGQLDVRACFPLVMQHLARDCVEVVLCGIEGVTGVLAREVKRTVHSSQTGERIESAREWLLETDGNNLLGSFAVHGIDHRRTRCNNPVQVAKVLGIEAARRSLFEELRAVLQFDGAYVNYRHIALLCDIMTNAGALMAVSRHGLNRRRTGPLMRATLEESVSMLANAGCFSEFDPVAGPSERVATGRAFAHGTGSHVDVMLDIDALRNAKPTRVVSLADSFCKKDSQPSEWSVETSPFAPMEDANRLTMLREMREYVTRERERAERARTEHEAVMRDLQRTQQRREDFDLRGAQAPFARPAPDAHASNDFFCNDATELPSTVANPFASRNLQPARAQLRASDTDRREALPADLANPFSQTTTSTTSAPAISETSQNGGVRQLMVSQTLDEETRIKFANPFAQDRQKTARSIVKDQRNNCALSKIKKSAKNVHFYVPSLPIMRN